ncbi:MAG TPA: lipopolysaccharide assembly protein LapA domain-containing protein [Gammaproteobacteria bacterium]|nr:lipopolysaccharide assembly protein LapA domain-containing protein [Gammaproteobacteria bacterium]
MLALIVFFIGLLFALRNAGPVNVDVIWGTFQAPLSYIVLGGCIVGVVVGFAAAVLSTLRLRHENRRLRRAVRSAKDEVSSLRKAPLQDAR